MTVHEGRARQHKRLAPGRGRALVTVHKGRARQHQRLCTSPRPCTRACSPPVSAWAIGSCSRLRCSAADRGRQCTLGANSPLLRRLLPGLDGGLVHPELRGPLPPPPAGDHDCPHTCGVHAVSRCLRVRVHAACPDTAGPLPFLL